MRGGKSPLKRPNISPPDGAMLLLDKSGMPKRAEALVCGSSAIDRKAFVMHLPFAESACGAHRRVAEFQPCVPPFAPLALRVLPGDVVTLHREEHRRGFVT